MTVLRSGSATDVGRVRKSNQDVALEETDLFAVADGMGGHVGGEVAARVAVDQLRESFRRDPSVEGLRRAVAEANEAVWRRSQDQTGLRGMGTTLTATALVTEPGGRKVIALANVGDSRAYVYTRGRAIQVTADHSLAEEKVRQGELTEAEAAIHPHRHILTRALGVSSDVDVDLWELHLHEGDRVLLCSDGLTNEVDDEKIGEALGSVPEPDDAARKLAAAAVAHGGNDNVTVVVVDVLSADDRLVSSTGSRRQRHARVPRVEGASPQSAGAGAGATGAGATGAGAGAAAAAVADDEKGHGAGERDGSSRAAAGNGGEQPGQGHGQGRGSGVGRGVGSATATATAERPGGATATALAPATEPATDDEDVTGVAPAVNGYADAGPYRPMLGPVAQAQRRRERRKQRRRERRSGGRWLTVRVVLFGILLLAVAAAGYAFVRWYANDNWYVALDGNNLAVYRGRSGGFLGFPPKLVDRTTVTRSEVVPTRLRALEAEVQEPTLAAAKRYVRNLHQEFVSTQQLRNGVRTAPSTAPSGGAG
ncbi:MAG: Stp1/IreP family PP2C-type Ser/Thr phosphatase [Acidimicrobiales bacterium]